MKFIPRQLSAQPSLPPKAATTTRFLRLQPASDVPPVAPEPPRSEPAPEPADSPTAPHKPAPSTPITLPPAATGSQRLRLRPAPDIAPTRALPAFPKQPAPVEPPVVESPQLSPEPAPELFSSPAPEPPAVPETDDDAPMPVPAESSPPVAPSAPEPLADDRPMRITTKRLPNIFAAAPSARWMSSSRTDAPPLRLIPAAALAVPTETPIAPPEPVFPAPSETVASPSHAASEIAPEEIVSKATPSAPMLRPRPTSLLPAAPKSEEPDASPLGSSHRLTAPPVPLSRLKGGEPHTLDRGFWILLLFLAFILVGGLSFFGLTPRIILDRVLDLAQKSSAQPVVAYGVARLVTPQVELPLPGTIEAFQEASLFPHTSGYVKKWLVDMGDQVKEGQLLAQLDTPELDQQLTQARVAADQAKANLVIVQNAAPSWNATGPAHPPSQEDLDEKKIAISGAQADLDAAQANVARLVDLEKFKEIRAPFSGKITYRHIDTGGLVSPGPAAAHGELFRIAQTDPVRIFVDVPETNAPSIKPGVPANIQVTSYPNRVFHGEVHDAGALNDVSRTLRTEIRAANPDGALLPGALAEVRLQLLDSTPTLLIPAGALIVNVTTGTSVAILRDKDGHDAIHYAAVRVGRDFGNEVEIFGNVRAGDRLVTNPPPDLNEGAVVTAQAQTASH